jgi:NDP-sugar pyrophosphorylase family protein
MRPLTYERPKVMLPIAGKPIIEHLLEEVKEVGIDDFIFVVGYHDETIRDYFLRSSIETLRKDQYSTGKEVPAISAGIKNLEDKNKRIEGSIKDIDRKLFRLLLTIIGGLIAIIVTFISVCHV